MPHSGKNQADGPPVDQAEADALQHRQATGCPQIIVVEGRQGHVAVRARRLLAPTAAARACRRSAGALGLARAQGLREDGSIALLSLQGFVFRAGPVIVRDGMK